MKNKKTLEEATKNWITKNNGIKSLLTPDFVRESFIESAKWQSEKMYSEEDLKQFAWQCVANFLSNRNNKVEQNLVEVIIDRNNLEFEQFKKK
jgi:hypothetical protein